MQNIHTKRDQLRTLNMQINNQLTANGIIRSGKFTGKKIDDVCNDEWKAWIIDLIGIRDQIAKEC